MMKEKNSNCVELNIYVECNKCPYLDAETASECPERHDDENENCVKINVFAECDKKKWYDSQIGFRTCSHRICAYIFEHNLAENKAKICRHTGVWQEFLTQLSDKFAGKICAIDYESKFLMTAD